MKLNALLKTLGLLALASTPVLAGTAPAPKNPIAAPTCDDLGVTIDGGYNSNLIFRGVNFGQHWVEGGVAGGVALTEAVDLNLGLRFGTLAGNQDHFVIPSEPDQSYQRTVLNAGFGFDVDSINVGLGYRWYHHSSDLNSILDMEDGQEVGVTLGTKVGSLNLTAGGYYDWAIEGFYFEVGANTVIPVTDSISLVPAVTVGHGVDYTWHMGPSFVSPTTGGRDEIDGFTAVALNLGLPIKLNCCATLTPYIGANLPIGGLDDLPVATSGNPDTAFKSVCTWGVNLSVRF